MYIHAQSIVSSWLLGNKNIHTCCASCMPYEEKTNSEPFSVPCLSCISEHHWDSSWLTGFHGNHRYRHLARGAKNKSRELGRPVSGPQSIPSRTGTGCWSGDVGNRLDSSPFSSLGPSYEGMGSGFPGAGGASHGYPTGGEAVGVPQGYSEYSTMPTAGMPLSLSLSVSKKISDVLLSLSLHFQLSVVQPPLSCNKS